MSLVASRPKGDRVSPKGGDRWRHLVTNFYWYIIILVYLLLHKNFTYFDHRCDIEVGWKKDLKFGRKCQNPIK